MRLPFEIKLGLSFEDRINKVIHTDAFNKELEQNGFILMDFQSYILMERCKHLSDLPSIFQKAVIKGEEELNARLNQKNEDHNSHQSAQN